MHIVYMAMREIVCRKLNFALGVTALAVAAGTLLSVCASLRGYDIRSNELLARKEQELQKRLKALQNEMRKATLKLSFNLAILPGGQDLRDWHEKDHAEAYMPEEYVHRLADSKILTVRHFLPMLQRKTEWPETKRTIILIGCRGEVPNLHKSPRVPLVQPVPEGKITVGHELHQSLGLEMGQKVRLRGREFVVHKCHEERGSKDDITAWIPLKDAQELFGKPGLINAILARECTCLGSGVIDRIRADVAKRLPDTKVVEFGTKALARSEARAKVKEEAIAAMEREKRNQQRLRTERETLASLAVSGALGVCVIWVFSMAFINAWGRRPEVAFLRAIGYRARQIFVLFLTRAILSGVVGGLVGSGAGLLLAAHLRGELDAQLLHPSGILSWPWLLVAMALAIGLSALAGWIPALVASQQDPAEILKEE